MSRNKRERATGRRSIRPFLMLPKDMLDSTEFAALSAPAVKITLDIARLHNGKNNGEIKAPFGTLIRDRHWRSRTSLCRALGEAIQRGFLMRTRRGRNDGGNASPSLYAISWQPIPQSELHTAASRVAPNPWRLQNSGPRSGLGTAKPVHVVDRKRGKDGRFCTRIDQNSSPQARKSSPWRGLSSKIYSRDQVHEVTHTCRSKAWLTLGTAEYDAFVARHCYFEIPWRADAPPPPPGNSFPNSPVADQI